MPITLDSVSVLQRRGGYGTPYFVITGTGRSATAYTAKLLTEAGVTTGHEANFHPFFPKHQYFQGDGEVSWLAAPHVTGPLHQLRHPLKVVASLQYPTGFMVGAYEDNPFWQYKARYVDFDGWDPVVNACRFVVEWTNLIESTDPVFTYRIEDMNTELLTDIAERIGWPITTRTAEAALKAVPTDYNSKPHATTLTWDDVTPQLRELGERYGYE